jgi:hypothetical protein
MIIHLDELASQPRIRDAPASSWAMPWATSTGRRWSGHRVFVPLTVDRKVMASVMKRTS